MENRQHFTKITIFEETNPSFSQFGETVFYLCARGLLLYDPFKDFKYVYVEMMKATFCCLCNKLCFLEKKLRVHFQIYSNAQTLNFY